MIIDGNEIAKKVAADLREKEGAWQKKTCAAFLIGENGESESFLKKKKEFAQSIGVDFRIYRLSSEMSNDALRKEIGRISRSSSIGGAIVQLPLPEAYNTQSILNAIPKEKDIDCLSERALGGFYTGRWVIGPPAVMAFERILSFSGTDLKHAVVVVVGRGRLIGKPLVLWLLDKAKEVHVVYIGTEGDASDVLRRADIIVSGVGKKHLIGPDMIQEGAALIDFGYYYESGRVFGDIDAGACAETASLVTPTPGGTGPIVVAELFYNFYLLNSPSK